MGKPTITKNIKDSYKELKSSLKDKYANSVYLEIDLIRNKATKEMKEILGNDFFVKSDKIETLKLTVSTLKANFFDSEIYKNTQSKLVDLKNKLEQKENKENSELLKELNKVISEASTLNVTIKNRVKSYTDQIKENEKVLEEIVSSNATKLTQIKNEVMLKLKSIIADCVKNYNEELNELNDTFGIKSGKPELPFDEKLVKFDLPLFVFNEDFVSNNKGSNDKNYIPSDNNNVIKN